MACPAAKRRKLDPNAEQMHEGYDVEVFMNQTEANRYLCIICQCVYKDAYNIGCKNEHVFCKGCLDKYFVSNNAIKSCPSCRQQGLTINCSKPCRIIQRLVGSLKVKCPLQLQQNEYTNSNNIHCVWNGELSDLDQHVNISCSLGNIICDYCQQNMKRYQSTQHDNICSEKPVICNLKCGIEIKRGLMETHQNHKCLMKMLSCDDCKENVLRKDIQKHMLTYCPEYEIMCSFNQYGCIARIKRKLMDNHLKENEMQHLKMKLNTFENELVLVKQLHKNQETINDKYKLLINDQTRRIKYLETLNDKHGLLLLLQSKNVYITGVESGKKQKIEIASFMNERHGKYCIGNDIGLSAAKQIGFNAKDLNVIGNNIVFGISRKKISAVNLKTKICKTFSGNTSFKTHFPIYCNYGLILVGGSDVDDYKIANNDIYKIGFNNDKFTKKTLTKLPYSTCFPSVCMINDIYDNNGLFVCGGWWNKKNLTNCYLYSFNNQWKELKSMNHGYACSGICVWKERGNKIIVGGGFEDIRDVEEYDMHKNKWIDLPKLNETHKYYPALLTSNNVLFCVGGVKRNDTNLGYIELYDPRDQSNKWIYVDSVQNYFNISQDAGAGHNCFLSL